MVNKKEQSVDPFQKCEYYLNDPAHVYFIPIKIKNKFHESLILMNNYINKVNNNIKITENKLNVIEECINLLKTILYQTKQEKNFYEFIRYYLFICYNINNNIFKNKTIASKIEHLQRYIDNCLTFSETIQNFSNVTSQLSNWKEWIPPSFKLSEHYFNVLKEE